MTPPQPLLLLSANAPKVSLSRRADRQVVPGARRAQSRSSAISSPSFAEAGAAKRAAKVARALAAWADMAHVKGVGHNEFFTLAARLKAAGMDLGEIESTLRQEAWKANNPAERREQIKVTRGAGQDGQQYTSRETERLDTSVSDLREWCATNGVVVERAFSEGGCVYHRLAPRTDKAAALLKLWWM